MFFVVDISGRSSLHIAVASGAVSSSARNRNFGDSRAACSAHDSPASALLAQTVV